MQLRSKVEIYGRCKFTMGNNECEGIVIKLENEETPVCITTDIATAKDIVAAINFVSSVPDKFLFGSSMSQLTRLWGKMIHNYDSVLSALILEYEDSKAPDCDALQKAKEMKSELAKVKLGAKELCSDDTIAP